MTETMHPTDLEGIVTMLEIAAIYLTPAPGSWFTVEQLLAEAKTIGGDEYVIDEADARIVIANAGFLVKGNGGRLCLR